MNISYVITGLRRSLSRLLMRAAMRLSKPSPRIGEDYTTHLSRRVQDAEAEGRRERTKLLGAMYAEDEGLLDDD